MTLSISDIANEYKSFITDELSKAEQSLQPSTSEDEELVRRASFAVRNKSVLFEKFIPFSESLYIIVQDVRIAEIKIDFQHQTILCNCKREGYCRHKLASLLALYQQFNSVQEWTSNWRAKKNLQFKPTSTERIPENWQLMVDDVMQHLLKEQNRIEGYLIANIVDQAHLRLKKYMPFEREWQPIFKLFMEIAVLNFIWKHLNNTNSSTQSDYMEYFIEKSYDRMITYANELHTKSKLFSTDPFYDSMQKLVNQLLLDLNGQSILRLQIYLFFWSKLFNERARALNEYEFLQSSQETPELSKPILELIPLLVLNEREKISSSIHKINENSLIESLYIAQFALQLKQLEDATLILKSCLPFLPTYIENHLAPAKKLKFTRFVDSLYTEIALTDVEEIQLYTSYGKFGVRPYADYLLKEARFEEWIALQQLYPSSLAHLEATGLKTITEQSPALTLPLYHFYALEELNQKSRMNYKQAVRIWKSMKVVAKKAGKSNYFQQYMQTIQTKYKRLRALQEELEKSNLFN